jgi:hypothetical protein
MTDERTLMLRQVDQAWADFYVIEDELAFIKAQLPRLPTSRELAHTALLVTLSASALVLAEIKALFG